MRDIGFNAVRPQIARISFRKSDYITLYLADGRIIYTPLTRFPGIDRLTAAERRYYHIADGAIILFQNDDEVYHIQDFLGSYEANSYKSSAKRSMHRSPNGIGSSVNSDDKAFIVKSAKKKVVAEHTPQ